MSTVNDHKDKLADDINASYFLTRLEDLIKTEKFLQWQNHCRILIWTKGRLS